jgi:potassium-transporting ATPase KdpC subunit
MLAHLRANLILLGLTLLIGAVLYPLVIWGVGQTVFHDKAEGSLLKDKKTGNVVGSLLVGQDFQDDKYFHPRPSATNGGSYNAAESGASNWAASNPRLRDRVARQLGPVVKDHDGIKIGPEVEKWALNLKNAKGEKVAPLAYWLENNPKLAEAWLSDNASVVDAWREAQGTKDPFFEVFAVKNPGAFPDVQDTKPEVLKKQPDAPKKEIVAVKEGDVIQGAFFDLWLRAHPERARKLTAVPADQVTASASGLDPHITLRNARTQVPDIVDVWAKEKKTSPEKVGQIVEKALEDLAFTPLLGSEKIVNVLELNYVLRRELEKP